MIELSINSDVTTKFMTLKDGDLMSYVDFDDHFLFSHNEVEKRIHFEYLYNLNLKLEKKIFLLLPSLEKNIEAGVSYARIIYEGNVLKVDYRKQDHYMLGMLINLKTIIDVTITNKGVLYVFNNSILNCFRNASVTSLLKMRNGLTVGEIEKEINKLAEEFKSVKKINNIEVEKSIQHLKSLGFIDNDIYEEEKYKLTAKGYMLNL